MRFVIPVKEVEKPGDNSSHGYEKHVLDRDVRNGTEILLYVK